MLRECPLYYIYIRTLYVGQRCPPISVLHNREHPETFVCHMQLHYPYRNEHTPLLNNSSSTRFLCLFDFPSSFFPTHLLLSILSTVVPIYNAELAPSTHRGRLVSLNQLAITAGIMVSFLVDLLAAMYYSGWRVALGVQCLFGLVFTFGMVFLPETPR